MFHHSIQRREFLKGSALSVAVLAAGAPAPTAIAKPLRASDLVTLGRSKLLASRQGLGVGDGKAEAYRKMGQAGFTKLIRHAIDEGVRYFDLLPGPAHAMMAQALKGVPRERYVLVTNYRHPEETNPARMVECYLRELKTDYLDAVLAGAILTKDWATEAKWAEKRDLLSAAMERGQVRAKGVSVHGWEALKAIATDPWVELALVSCNHKGAWMDGPPGRELSEIQRRDLSVPLIADIHAAGIGTAGMKVFSHSGYRDTENPAEERRKAIRYVMSQGTVDTLPIMCESIQEFDEVAALIDEAERE